MRVPGKPPANLVETRSHAPQVRRWETFAENCLAFTSSPATSAGNVSLAGNQNYISQNSVRYQPSSRAAVMGVSRKFPRRRRKIRNFCSRTSSQETLSWVIQRLGNNGKYGPA